MHCGDQRHAGLYLGRSPCTSRRWVQGRSQGTTLSASDLHNARATILNPFYNMVFVNINKKGEKNAMLLLLTNGPRRQEMVSIQPHLWILMSSFFCFGAPYGVQNWTTKSGHNKTLYFQQRHPCIGSRCSPGCSPLENSLLTKHLGVSRKRHGSLGLFSWNNNCWKWRPRSR